jgi:hypothetical protein
MEMQLSPFLSATFGIFIMQQIGRNKIYSFLQQLEAESIQWRTVTCTIQVTKPERHISCCDPYKKVNEGYP